MPWPATHILIAEKFFDQHFGHLNRKHFILGTCFPDIRYPAKIERGLTHFSSVSLSEIQSQSAFKAGLLFHSLVDGMWNIYIGEHEARLLSEIPHNRPMFHTMKILQDYYLYGKLDDWQRVTSYFGSVLPEEHTFGIIDTMVTRWHEMLGHYLLKPPNIEDLTMLSVSLPAALVGEIRTYYQQYQENATLIEILPGFYDQAERLLEEY